MKKLLLIALFYTATTSCAVQAPPHQIDINKILTTPAAPLDSNTIKNIKKRALTETLFTTGAIACCIFFILIEIEVSAQRIFYELKKHAITLACVEGIGMYALYQFMKKHFIQTEFWKQKTYLFCEHIIQHAINENIIKWDETKKTYTPTTCPIESEHPDYYFMDLHLAAHLLNKKMDDITVKRKHSTTTNNLLHKDISSVRFNQQDVCNHCTPNYMVKSHTTKYIYHLHDCSLMGVIYALHINQDEITSSNIRMFDLSGIAQYKENPMLQNVLKYVTTSVKWQHMQDPS